MIDSGILPIVVEHLKHENPDIRLAAASCMRSLSRSVKNLRTSLVDAGVMDPLMNLVEDPLEEVGNALGFSIVGSVRH